jgi:Ser/Thr protein kinase RdoA (MazF antagonist)
VRRIQGGLVSWHWHVRTQNERLVLRRYNPWRADVAYEHRVLAHLSERGWPVAVAMPAIDGQSFVRVEGEAYALFPHLPGRPKGSSSPSFARARGRMLADLHGDLEALVVLGQREEMAMMNEYAVQPLSPNGRTFNEILPAFVRAHLDLGRSLERHHERLAPILADLSGLPNTVVHGDFSKWNLLFDQSRLSGVLDFDFTRLDLRMADVAISTRYEHDPLVWSALVGGYSSRAALNAAERDAFVPLRMARGFTHAANALGWWETGREDMLAEVERGVRELDRDEADERLLVRTLESVVP